MNVEEMLRRELNDVANSLQVPHLPPLPQESTHTHRPWQLLLVAAAVVLAVVGADALISEFRSHSTPTDRPSPSVASPIENPTPGVLTKQAPTVPYLFDWHLYVEGQRLPGSWWTVTQAGGVWVAEREDNTWWWGTDPEASSVPGGEVTSAQLSPDGTQIAAASSENGGQVLLVDTRSGDTVAVLPSELDVDAVTNDGHVFLTKGRTHLMWLAANGDETVALSDTAPNQQVVGSTPAGLIVFDQSKETTYLADVSDAGEVTRLLALPGQEIAVNPLGTWFASGGSWGGESPTDPTMHAQSIDDGQFVTLHPPDGREMLTMAWEDADLVVARLFDDGTETGLARCSVSEARCVVIDAP